MAAYYGWEFHTKLELAAALIEWLVQQLGPDRPPIWVVTDGAYAKRPFLKRVLAAGVTVISRLRCDAALWSLPVTVDPGQKKGRGRPPKYGKQRINLAKRAAQTRGLVVEHGDRREPEPTLGLAAEPGLPGPRPLLDHVGPRAIWLGGLVIGLGSALGLMVLHGLGWYRQPTTVAAEAEA